MDPAPSSSAEFVAAHAAVCALCDHFDSERDVFTGDAYKEAEARVQFITPFFKALGWDVDNAARRSVYEKDVVIEKREIVADHALSADYAFRRPGSHLTAFFVEAKKPARDIRNHQDCYQAVQYGWNAKIPLVVLTNFAQLFVLDARAEPDKENSTRFILRQGGTYASRDYRDADRFAELWGLLGRSSVGAGSLDKAAAALPRLSGRVHRDDLFARGTGPVDETFLAELEVWRERLAKQFKKDNHDLDGERLTSLTQRILDRLVFLRFLEDRGIEREVTFAAIGRGDSAWNDFLKVSARLNARYNGIIYKKDPSGCEDESLVVDDAVFAGVAQRFAPENSKYLFNSISVTILGSIYERFLGNVIVARNKTAIVEPKPEVRKAGGVYYTPDYIVRYIVAQTVGRAIEGKKPDEIAKLRFADIACGSGSFLVEVFACLIRYHLKWYLADGVTKWTKKGILRARERDDEHVLTLAEKRRLLLANVYGVDLDPQAVEVTQLSLYLRLMEDESFPSTQLLFDEERRALLPNLWNNIVRGNSLVETDITDLFGLPPDEQESLAPLDLAWSFEKIRPDRSGAVFDAVVGNPPYVRQELLTKLKSYLEKKYECFSSTGDLYTFFMERGVKLLKPGGRYGIIVSSSFLRANFGESLRRTLKKSAAVERVVDFGGLGVFDEAKDTYVCIPLLTKEPQAPRIEIAHVKSLEPTEVEPQMRRTSYTVPHERFSPHAWSLASDAEITVFDKLRASGKPLGEVIAGAMYFGIKTGLKEAFVISSEERALILAASPTSSGFIHPCRGGEDIREYFIRQRNDWLIVIPHGFTRVAMNAAGHLGERKAWQWFSEHHPLLAARLATFRKGLEAREDQGEFWWELRPCDYYEALEHPKIVFPDICKSPRFSYDETGIYVTNTAYVLGTGDKYLLGLLNSRVFWFCIRHISIPFGTRAGKFRYRMFYQYVEQVPIHVANLDDPGSAARHAKIVGYVDKMLAAKIADATTNGTARDAVSRQIEALDRQINSLVYELYGLTDDEIALVEGEP